VITLPTRELGRTGLALTELGFGSGPLGGMYRAVGDEEAVGAVEAAFAAGVRYVDTAPFYGHGLAEHRAGQALRCLPRDEVVLSTKVGRLLRPRPAGPPESPIFATPLAFDVAFDYSYDGTRRSLEDSFQRLGLPAVDLVLIHDVNPRWHGEAYPQRFEEAMRGAYRALDELRREGAIKAIGVGVNDVRVCLEFARAGHFDAFMLAGRYTLLDQEALGELLPYCHARGIGLLLAAPFNSGILASGTRGDARFWYERAPAEVVERVRAIEAVSARHDVPLAAAALQFPLGHPAVVSVVAGCRSAAEAEQNAALIRRPIPAAFWAELKREGLIPEAAPTP